MGEVKEKTIVSRVSDVDQAAFKAEAAELRKALRALQRDRWKWACGEEPASDEALADFYRRLLPIQDRLRDWQGVLMEDEWRIRSPVRLWDNWNRLQNAADHEALEWQCLCDDLA